MNHNNKDNGVGNRNSKHFSKKHTQSSRQSILFNAPRIVTSDSDKEIPPKNEKRKSADAKSNEPNYSQE